jgi:hypothetical protein
VNAVAGQHCSALRGLVEHRIERRGRWRRDRAEEEVEEGGAQGDEDEREGKRER